MNLTTESWIPVVWKGTPGTVSLQELFVRGHDIQDLAVRPHERIAVMRLLICIAQAALDGPCDQDDWRTCSERLAPAALRYLKQWQPAFELLGSGTRFLQVPNLDAPGKGGDPDEGSSPSKLDLTLATGNNATLFDNAGGSVRSFSPSELALALVTHQCFSPGGRIGVALWDGAKTAGNGSSKHAPCLAGGIVHALLRAETVLATLHKNLMTKHLVEQFFGKSAWGKPVWEMMPCRLADSKAVANASRTYLGRLVPISRAIHLSDDCRSLVRANGLDYPTFDEGWREPAATVVTTQVKNQPKQVLLRASTERAVWRELHALTVKGKGLDPGGPAALQNIVEEEGDFDLWVGGLVANKAKLLETVESVFRVPAEMLNAPAQRRYEKGVDYAESVELRLIRAVKAYHKELGDKLDRPEMKDRRRQIQRQACGQFWSDVEQAVNHLLELIEHPESLGLRNEWHKTMWGQTIWRCACEAYTRACAHATPRQIRAHALGLNALFRVPAASETPESEEETE